MTTTARPTAAGLRPAGEPGASRAPRQYRGALIGLGGIARQSHLPGFTRDPAVRQRLRLVATVDGDEDAAPLEAVPHFATRDELDAVGPLDFVDICTPTASHLELTLWALERGYHVLCEKPVAVSRMEARRITDAARAAGRIVMPCHQHRHNPVWRRIRHWLREGAIGRWHLCEMHVYRLMADRGHSADATPWRALSEHSRGGVLLDHGTHLIYQMLDAAGLPGAVRAWTGQLRHLDYDVEDSAHLLFEYPGRLGVMFLTWGACHRENRVRFVGERGMIEWTGGMLRLESAGETTEIDFSAQLDKASYAGWFATLFASFADAMDRRDGEAALRDISGVAAVIESAYSAARTGCRTEVPPLLR